MRCKQGDLAFVTRAINLTNVGKVVTVLQYCGFFQAGEVFVYNDIFCKVPITDHYWWITTSREIDTAIGPTSRAYGPDSWLLPIRPDDSDVHTNAIQELETHK